MDDLEPLLAEMARKGITLWVEDGKLNYRAKAGAIDEATKSLLRERKAQILDRLGGAAEASRRAPTIANQRAMWLQEQMYPGTPLFVNSVAFLAPDGLPLPEVESAVEALVRRHSALRSVIRDQGKGMERLAYSRDLFGVRYRECGKGRVALESAVREEADAPIRPDGPLFRITVVRPGAGDLDRHAGLVVAAHHLISDATSIRVILQDFRRLLKAALTGAVPPAPQTGTDFLAFCEWENAMLDGSRAARLWEHWKGALSGSLPRLALPMRRIRPAATAFVPAIARISFGKERSGSAKALARKEGATPFAMALTLLYALFHRYTGQKDFIIGSAMSNRMEAGTEETVGYFSNMVPLRAEVEGSESFLALLGRVKGTLLEAIAHQAMPLPLLVGKLNPTREGGETPLFSVVLDSLILESFGSSSGEPGEDAGLPGLQPVEGRVGAGPMDLFVFMRETADGFDFDFRYDASVFPAADMEGMARHFLNLWDSAMADPQTPVSRLEIMDAAEKRTVLETWNDTAAPLEEGDLFLHAFARHVAANPGGISVSDAAGSLTYAGLDEASRRLSWRLHDLGIGPGSRVGIRMAPGTPMMAALLAVWKAGATYIPLDPAYPPARIDAIVADCAPSLILTDSSWKPAEGGPNPPVLRLGSEAEAAGGPCPEGMPAVPRGDSLAYVIYTSGSTGIPKGVAVRHRSLANLLKTMAAAPGLGAEDRLIAVGSFSFDISIPELYLPLSAGAQLFLAGLDARRDGQRLAAEIVSRGITVMQATPTLWKMVLEHLDPARFRLRRAWIGGEALTPEIAARLFAVADEVWNLYGPTETTVWSTIRRMGDPGEEISIGRPIANTRIYILDPNLNPLPPGALGEICIAGAGVSAGYLDRPSEEGSVFLPDPFDASPGARLYRTGDLGCFTADGQIRCLGRKDFQVKVRGFRIELGEVESALKRQKSVKDAVADVRPGRDGSGMLVAYLIPSEPGAAVEEAGLRRALRSMLPEYMVPSRLVVMERFPLTSTHKVDRKALPDPAVTQPGDRAGFVAPEMALEKQLAEIWKEVLGVPVVGVEDNFFDIGGHSLLLAEVHAKLVQRTSLPADMLDLFTRPTIRSLATFLTAGGRQPEAAPRDAVDRGSLRSLALGRAMGRAKA